MLNINFPRKPAGKSEEQRKKQRRDEEPEEEGTEKKEQLAPEASTKNGEDQSNHSSLGRSPLILDSS